MGDVDAAISQHAKRGAQHAQRHDDVTHTLLQKNETRVLTLLLDGARNHADLAQIQQLSLKSYS